MTKKKTKYLLIILGVISLIGGIFFRVMLMDLDDAIIRYGSQTVRTYQTVSTLLFSFFFLMLIAAAVLHLMEKMKAVNTKKEVSKAKQLNPNYDETEIVSKLRKLAESNNSYVEELAAADQSINQINDCMEDLQELQENNEYDLLDKINYSMVQAKTQILQNTKSIINRVTVEGDHNEINKRLTNNSEIVLQVRELLNETVNYLDSKSPSTKADLENMTKALQTLNKTIE